MFVLNTIGQLAKLYSKCDVVFMGGSLIHHGGQNPLEPAAANKPIITGPNYFNFKDIYSDLIACGGAAVVSEKESLYTVLNKLLGDSGYARAMGDAAQALIEKNRGATGRNIELIKKIISEKKDDLHVANY